MSPVVTQADRAGWQRRAAAELAQILEGHPELPCITWTVGPAGSVITGRDTWENRPQPARLNNKAESMYLIRLVSPLT